MEIQAKFSTLFVVAHPFLERSRANRVVLEAVKDVPGLTLRNLYDLYPYFHIDIEEEQKQILAHDLLVVQHPLYWFSMPALLKEWLDEVWHFGWAYGPGGDKLKGKNFLLSVTVGGAQEAHAPSGYAGHPLETLLSPWDQTVNLCEMKWHKPLVIHNAFHADAEELRRHAVRVRETLDGFAQKGVLR